MSNHDRFQRVLAAEISACRTASQGDCTAMRAVCAELLSALMAVERAILDPKNHPNPIGKVALAIINARKELGQ